MLTGEKFIPELHYDNYGLFIVFKDPLLIIMKLFKKLEKQVI